MHVRIALLTALVLAVMVPAVHAAPFINPPEDAPVPWVHPYPYQRNALVDFSTDVNDWLPHWDNPSAWALNPATNYHLQGGDDYAQVGGREMWEYDWLQVAVLGGSMVWLDEDTWFDSGRQGLLGFESDVDTQMVVMLTWNMANWPGGQKSHLWSEFVWKTDLEWPLGDAQLALPPGYDADGDWVYTYQDERWVVMNGSLEIEPSPAWQRLNLHLYFPEPDPGGRARLAVDSWHTATEAPEPATVALFSLGAAGLALWRRRRRRD